MHLISSSNLRWHADGRNMAHSFHLEQEVTHDEMPYATAISFIQHLCWFDRLAGFFWATRTIGTHPPTPGSRAASTADPARWTRRAATHTHTEAAHRHTHSWSVGRSEQENSKTSCVLSLERHEEKGLYDLLFLGNPCTHVCSPWSTTNSQCIMHTAGSFSP